MKGTGRLLAMGYVLFFLVLVRDLRSLVDFVDVALLPATPTVVVGGLIAFSAALTVRGGIEMVTRATELWAPMLILVALALPLLTLNSLEVRFLAPPFEWGAALLLFLVLRPVSAPPARQQEAAPM